MKRCELDILDVTIPGRPMRSFTLAQANRSLVLLRRVVEDVVDAYQRAVELQQVIECARLGPDYGQRRQADTRLTETVEELQGYLWELDEMGVELRDWQAGRVEFPARAAGRHIRLSWQLGDPEVLYWHEIDSDCEELRHIDTLPGRRPQPVN